MASTKRSSLILAPNRLLHLQYDLMENIVRNVSEVKHLILLSLACSSLFHNMAVISEIKELVSKEAVSMFTSFLDSNNFSFERLYTVNVIRSFVLREARCFSINWTWDVNVKCSWTESTLHRHDGSVYLRPIINQIDVPKLESDEFDIAELKTNKNIPMANICHLCPWFAASHPIFSFKGDATISFEEYGGAMGNGSGSWWRQMEIFFLKIPTFAGHLTLTGEIMFVDDPRRGDIHNMDVSTHINWTCMELSL
tara:strand:+ start:566 stop:1324 length:759 start_codon:yes stop_codon:yes gene_type:complete